MNLAGTSTSEIVKNFSQNQSRIRFGIAGEFRSDSIKTHVDFQSELWGDCSALFGPLALLGILEDSILNKWSILFWRPIPYHLEILENYFWNSWRILFGIPKGIYSKPQVSLCPL